MNEAGVAARGGIERSVLVLLALAVGAFTLFVGYNKALAPLSVLVEHKAWTIHIPVVLGRTVGWLEVAASLTLIASLLARRFAGAGLFAACWIFLTHNMGALVHVCMREWDALPQSAVLFALCAVLMWLCLHRFRGVNFSNEGAGA